MNYRGFDPGRFQKNLEKKQHIASDFICRHSPGVFKALDYIFCFYSANQVDFDSFTLEDMEAVRDEAHRYDCVSEEDIDRNRYNAVHEYIRCIDNLGSLHQTKNKIYPVEDDFI